jgi:hypothetical protein
MTARSALSVPLMTRALTDGTYSDGNIASGKCSGCGQIFATVALAAPENPEWGLVGAFGSYECTPAPLKPAE